MYKLYVVEFGETQAVFSSKKHLFKYLIKNKKKVLLNRQPITIKIYKANSNKIEITHLLTMKDILSIEDFLL